MPTISSRRGPTGENGGTQHEIAFNQSHGRVPLRAQTSNDIQRNTASVSGMNGVVEDDPNAMTTRIDAGLQQPTPLFERLVTEEVQELRAYVRIVENQNRRLVELERVHGDLEARLEAEAKSRQQVEATLEAREREWAEKLEHVERDRDHWKDLVEAEKIKNSKLIDQVHRKDQDIHRMLQRKYDNEITRSTRNARSAATTGPNEGARDNKPRNSSPKDTSAKTTTVADETVHKGPHQILAAVGSAEKVRNRNAKSLLMDIFGM